MTLSPTINYIVGVANWSGRINQWQCSIPGLAIGNLVLSLLLRLRQPSFHWIISDRSELMTLLATPIFDFISSLIMTPIATAALTPSLVQTSPKCRYSTTSSNWEITISLKESFIYLWWKKLGSGGIRTHATEETGAFNKRPKTRPNGANIIQHCWIQHCWTMWHIVGRGGQTKCNMSDSTLGPERPGSKISQNP